MPDGTSEAASQSRNRLITLGVGLVSSDADLSIMASPMMPKVPDLRIYCHAETGEEAHVDAGSITGPAGQGWEVRLVRADGRPEAVAGQTVVD